MIFNDLNLRKRSRAWLWLSALLTAVALSACAANTDFMRLPTSTPAPAIAGKELKRSVLQDLAMSATIWRHAKFSGNEESSSSYAHLMIIQAQGLQLDFGAEDLKAAEDYESSEEAVRNLYEQLGQQYGSVVKETFLFSYQMDMMAFLLGGVSKGTFWVEVLARRREANEYLRAALTSAERLGATSEQLSHGFRLETDMNNGKDSAVLQAELEEWREKVVYGEMGRPTLTPPPTAVNHVGTLIQQELPPGNASRAEALLVKNACVGCHGETESIIAPSWFTAGAHDGLNAAQSAESRLQADDYTGQATNVSEYLLESIVQPDADVTTGFSSGVMPSTYGERLSRQDTADLIAYLLSVE